MGTITINVNDKTENNFRRVVRALYGENKGNLGRAITEAMELWVKKESDENALKTLEFLEKGFDLGGLAYKNRDELHER